MSEQPPDNGAPETPPPGPSGPPPGYVPPTHAQAPYNPYAQPPGAPSTQPVWQGHQAPEQGWPGAPGQSPAAKRGRKWLVALVVVLGLILVGGAITAAVLIGQDDDDMITVSDIEQFDCFNSPDLGNPGGAVESLESADCDGDHDAEAFATLELDDDENLQDAGARCVDELDDVGRKWSDFDEAGIEIRPLAGGTDAGDTIVCFIRRGDGEPLTASEFK